jgi:hypothetical protein
VRLLATTILTGMMLVGCATSNQLPALSQMPSSVVSEGSLANEKLTTDTTAALIKAGYAQPNTQIVKFVMQQPQGAVGQRAWRELWVTSPKDNSMRFVITFTEDGQNAADFEIQKAQPKVTK